MKIRVSKKIIETLAGLFLLIGVFFLWRPMLPVNGKSTKADAAVVLGGTSKDRIILASRLHRDGLANQIVVTGDLGEIVKALRDDGMPASALIHESKATSTVENAMFSKPLLEQIRAKNVIIVTSWYHAGRAQRVFQFVCPDINFSVAYIPEDESHDLNGRQMLLREKLAILHSTFVRGVPCLW
jgi:uncharacterized SAM-binding protein YcdF (DUF218 family)